MKFKIVPVNERNARLFNGLPKFIYKNDPNWVPHLKTDIDYVFKENKNKYFALYISPKQQLSGICKI